MIAATGNGLIFMAGFMCGAAAVAGVFLFGALAADMSRRRNKRAPKRTVK